MKLQRIAENTIGMLNDEKDIIAWLKEMRVYEHGKFIINEDLTVDVHCDMYFYANSTLGYIPIKFGEVNGSIMIADNRLTSLHWAPTTISGSLDCSNNKLKNLIGSPREVGGNFYCGFNKLTSLEGAPREVGGDFYCDDNQLTSLEGGPREVGGNFDCYGNKFISEPDHSHINIRGDFIWE